ncbi:MAG: tRNA (cytidine(34)-2'-O)-methyltransferase [Burkholderiales bacterium]
MFNIVLYQPEIPPNTGNIIRLAANAGCNLHLVRPMGFQLNDRELRRAGMDYRDLASVTEHSCWDECTKALSEIRMFAFSTRSTLPYTCAQFLPGDALLFGPETRGLPIEILQNLPEERRLRLPMHSGSRSLNLANAVAIGVYEAWRQNGFRTDATL